MTEHESLGDLSPEQHAAYRQLDESIAALHHAFGDPGLLVEWVLITTLTDPQNDGTDRVATSWFGSTNQPLYRALGLVDYAATLIRDQIVDYD